MTLLRTAGRQRWTNDTKPAGCPASSAGQFVIRADGTARFDRHYHDFDEFWFVASGTGTITIGDTSYQVQPGDILYTAAGIEHDITDVEAELRIFWLSTALPDGSSGAHLHRSPQLAGNHLVPVRPSGDPQ